MWFQSSHLTLSKNVKVYIPKCQTIPLMLYKNDHKLQPAKRAVEHIKTFKRNKFFIDSNAQCFICNKQGKTCKTVVAPLRWIQQTNKDRRYRRFSPTSLPLFVSLLLMKCCWELGRRGAISVAIGNRDQSSTHKHMCCLRCYIWVWDCYLSHRGAMVKRWGSWANSWWIQAVKPELSA